VTLEVPGRVSGRSVRFPLGMADYGGQWYLVSMLGNDCNWVKNARASDGQVTIHHGRATSCQLAEIPTSERAPILKRYLERVPGARPHIPVEAGAPLEEFDQVAAAYPVFRVDRRESLTM
jgi:hypothetical protein